MDVIDVIMLRYQFSFMLVTLLVVIAGITVFILFEMASKNIPPSRKKIWKMSQRIFGLGARAAGRYGENIIAGQSFQNRLVDEDIFA